LIIFVAEKKVTPYTYFVLSSFFVEQKQYKMRILKYKKCVPCERSVNNESAMIYAKRILDFVLGTL